MKAFLVVALCLVASAFADFDYAGSTILGSTWNRPNWAYNDQQVLTCADSSPAANVQYQRFNASATGLTFWRILGAFEKDFRSYAEVLVYDATTFNPTTPCTGLLLAISSQSAAPPVDEYITANTGVYTIVISSDTVNQTGLFAINAIVAELTADNRNTTYQAAPIISSETTDCSDVSSTPVNIRTFSWSTNNTGAYDITVVAVWNTTASTTFYPTVAIFEGMFPNTTVNGTVLSLCNNGHFVYGGEGSSDGTLFLQSVNFTAGTIYTFAISAYDVDEIGDFGFFIEPTRWGNTETQPQTYNAPDVPATSTVANCTQSGTLKKYQNVVFEATNPVYIIDTSNGIDAATFLYEGVFTDAPPADCTGFIFGGDTGDGGPIAVVLTPGRNYTAVVTGYSSGAGQYSLYVMTGNPLGVPVTTTTGVPATTGDSGATTAVASMLLVVIAAFLAMF